MTKELEDRILNERIVDTDKFRYVFEECGDHAEIKRIPLNSLDTTEALTGWEIVKIIK